MPPWLAAPPPGSARPLVIGPTPEGDPAWSPDGTRIAFSANRGRDHDLRERYGIYVADVATGDVSVVANGSDSIFVRPTWTRDGASILAFGDRWPRAGYRTGIWSFAADGSERAKGAGTDLLARSELKPDAAMNSDITLGEAPRLV